MTRIIIFLILMLVVYAGCRYSFFLGIQQGRARQREADRRRLHDPLALYNNDYMSPRYISDSEE